MKTKIVLLLFAAVVLSVSAWGTYHRDRDAILLDDIKVLTLRKGEYTTSSRSKPVPQIKCVGGSARHNRAHYEPEVVQCRNMGSDGENIQWRCETDMPTDYRFGKTDISCEGFRDRHDPYVLKGSCGLEYTLEYTDQGKAREHQKDDAAAGRVREREYVGRSGVSATGGGPVSWLTSLPKRIAKLAFGVIVFVVLSAIFCGGVLRMIYRSLFGRSAQSSHVPHQRRGFFGSFFPAGSGPAAPTFRPAPSPGTGFYPPPPSAPMDDFKTEPQTTSSGPGFWTGAAVAGAAGYMAGRMAASRSQPAAATETVRVVERERENDKVPPSTTRTAVGFGETKKR